MARGYRVWAADLPDRDVRFVSIAGHIYRLSVYVQVFRLKSQRLRKTVLQSNSESDSTAMERICATS